MLVHLAAKTCFSLRDGVIRPNELAVAAWECGMEAVGVADRDGLYGAVRIAQACATTGVRAILGSDLALLPEPGRAGWGLRRPGRSALSRRLAAAGLDPHVGAARRPRAGPPDGLAAASARPRRSFAGPSSGPGWLEDDAARVVLIAADDAGFATLCRTVTDAHLDGERGDPHLRWSHVAHRLGGAGGGAAGGRVLVLLADDSPVGRLLDAGRVDAAEAEARRWMDVVGPEQVLCGVTHHLARGDDARARRWFALADRLGLRAVAHQAPRYLRPEDALVADVMDAVRQQVPLDPRRGASRSAGPCRGHDPVRGHAGPVGQRRNSEGWFKDAGAMARVFAERPDALRATVDVADACRVDLGLGRLRVPDFVALGEQADAELRVRCEHGVRERYARVEARHVDLLERELRMVAQLGLAPYFLTVAEVVDRIRSKGILAACRGSAAGSLVTYALRISDVDPVAHDLVFERFMNPYRDELPDIDIDVESARREDIYRDLLSTYGEDRVACVCMVETFKARMAIREVGKAIGLPDNEVDYVAKSFPHVRAADVRAALEHLPELQGLNLDAGQLGLLFDVVERLDGFPRHLALHPSGVLLADRTLRDVVPMERSAAGFAMAQYDKDDVEALGLCKLDVLAVRMLSSMRHCLDEVARTRGESFDFDEVPYDDEDTYDVIRSTRTLGMFQIESPGQRELVGRFQPEHLSDLIVDISLFRPGPVKGDMVKPFLQRRLGLAQAVVPHPLLERALGETYGVIVYHEQVMRSVAAVTGCDLATADLVRRRLGDPAELDELHAWIVASAVERGVPEEVAESLWSALAQFASFGFCKAHAAAFAVPTYRSAWLKTHYLPEFVAGLLTHDPGMYPRRLLLDDARQFGVCVLPLDVNRSGRDHRVERVPADEAYARLGVADPPATWASDRPTTDGSPSCAGVARGWRVPEGGGAPVPPSGFDKGADPRDPSWRFGIRLALQDVAQIDDRMIESLLEGRPFTSVEDLRRRARLSQPVVESLCHAGALDELGGVEVGVRTRRDLLLEVSERWSGLRRHRPSDPDRAEQLGLLAPEGPPGLPEYRASEAVRAELEVLGLDASRHVVSFYDGLLDVLRVTRAVDLLDRRDGQRVRVAGVKVATQTPPVKSGQRIIFLSLDDGTGVSDATFFESVHDRCAWTVFHTWLLVVEGTVHRSGRRGVSLNAERVWDLRRLMRAWQGGWLPDALRESTHVAGPDRRTTAATCIDPGRNLHPAAQDFGDGAPSERIRGAAGRSGLRLDPSSPHREDQPFGGMGPGVAVAADGWRAEVGRPSRIAPNGTTWADPAKRHPGVEEQDVSRLSPNDPRRAAASKGTRPVPQPDDDAGPSRKLWHASGGSAGR